jgi:hypothetical protein
MNTVAQIESAIRDELKTLLARYDATLSVTDGRIIVNVDEVKSGFVNHPAHEFSLGMLVLPARDDDKYR